MARNTEDRLPTAWVSSFAASLGAQLHEGWQGDDYRATLAGRTAAYPWELVIDGHLDTDYACTTRLRHHSPGGPSFSATSGGQGAATSGTELDLVFMAVSITRTLLKRRRDLAAGEANRPGSRLEVSDPGQVLTPQVLGWLEAWPDSVQARSNLHREAMQIRHSANSDVIDFTTEHRWGQAVVAHQLSICQWLVHRLELLRQGEPPG